MKCCFKQTMNHAIDLLSKIQKLLNCCHNAIWLLGSIVAFDGRGYCKYEFQAFENRGEWEFLLNGIYTFVAIREKMKRNETNSEREWNEDKLKEKSFVSFPDKSILSKSRKYKYQAQFKPTQITKREKIPKRIILFCGRITRVKSCFWINFAFILLFVNFRFK